MVATSKLCRDIFCSVFLQCRCRDLSYMSRHHCLPILPAYELRHVFLICDHFSKSIFGCTLNLPVFMSRHRSDVATRNRALCLKKKTSFNLFLLQGPLLWLHRRILVTTSDWCRDIIYILLASRHQSDVAT